MLGIIGAMDVEVNGLKEAMENPQVKRIAGMDFYQGSIADKEVVVVKCGIGKVKRGNVYANFGRPVSDYRSD